MRNGDVLVPGYDVEGKLWTIQYIKEDGTKRSMRVYRTFPPVAPSTFGQQANWPELC